MERFKPMLKRNLDYLHLNNFKVAVINLDDDYADLMLKVAKTIHLNLKFILIPAKSKLRLSIAGGQLSVAWCRDSIAQSAWYLQIQSPFLGQFNVENLIASLIAVEAAGFDLAELIETVPSFKVHQDGCK
jgi:UDP-N-acetylmuramoyl-L-alanyl-D-glutamate--2,6-diaminopimelate ligase